MAELAAGPGALIDSAGRVQVPHWRLGLRDHLIALGSRARKPKAETLVKLAEVYASAPARNTTCLREAGSLCQGIGRCPMTEPRCHDSAEGPTKSVDRTISDAAAFLFALVILVYAASGPLGEFRQVVHRDHE